MTIRKNKAPHCCGALRISDVIASLTRTQDITTVDPFATGLPLRLERPGIEPGAA